MKKLVIYHQGYPRDIIVVPQNIYKNPKKYQRLFDKWIYDKSNDHKYWIYEDGEKYGIGMCTEAFIEYLNKFHLNKSDEKAYIEIENAETFPKDLPYLYF